MYVCPGSRLKLNAITNKRMQNKDPFVTALTCEWYLYFCPNQTRSLVCQSALIEAFRKNISAVDIHFDGSDILTD